MKRVGVLAGSFDPVHNGHIAFALSAADVCGLDKVFFLPEPFPRGKGKATPFAERLEMLKIATKDHKNLGVLELGDEQFSVTETLPKLLTLQKNSQLFLLVGEDVAKDLPKWPNSKKLLQKAEIIVGQRSAAAANTKHKTIFTGFFNISSNKIRSQLVKGKKSDELLPAVNEYALKHQLYH